MRYIWTHTRPQQLFILFIVLASMPTYFMSLDLPKQIVNGPIQGRGFDDAEATQTFLRISLPVPQAVDPSGWLTLFDGFELNRLHMLFALSLVFLALVIINGQFKLYINTYKGRLGERMLRRIRYELIDRVLRFPMGQFKRVKPSEVASMVKDEVEPMGGFIGDAYVQPFFLGGQALTALIFIFVQNVWLGMIAFSIIVVQFVIIPRLRRRLLVLQRERQVTARQLAGRVGEIVEGIGSIHVNDTSNYERADTSSRLAKIFWIRYELYQRKFFVKFLNNFLAQLTPFLFYVVGGYFALRGTLDIGQLVAVIAAYKDLPSPIKELIDWDQQRLEVQVKYAQVVDQFTVDRLLPAAAQDPAAPPPAIPADAALGVAQLAVNDETGARLIENTTMTLAPGEQLALVGGTNSGAETLAEVLARLQPPTQGHVEFGGAKLYDLPETITGRRIGYAGADTYLPQGSVRDSLLYALKHAPAPGRSARYASDEDYRLFVSEAERSGNPTFDIDADWVDYSVFDAADEASVSRRIREVLTICGLNEDLFDLGLRGAIAGSKEPDLAARLLDARHALRRRLAAADATGLVEPFDPNRYSTQATVAENLLFGTPVGPDFATDNLAAQPYVQKVLADAGLDARLYDMGRQIAETTLELFQDLPPGHPFFEQLSFMRADQIPEYQQALARTQGQSYATASEQDRQMLVRLTFAYVEPRHRLGLLDEELMERLLDARRRFHDGLPAGLRSAIEFYDPDRYNDAASIADNVLLGRVAYGVAGGPERVLKIAREVLDEFGLADGILEVGLAFNVGSGGKRLTLVQRQKLMLARVVLKRPSFAVLNRPLSALDLRAQEDILRAVLDAFAREAHPPGVAWVVSNPSLSRHFHRVLVFDKGRVIEEGTPDDLARNGGPYARLVA
jgi:putative ABC transport system ATP-binding protein